MRRKLWFTYRKIYLFLILVWRYPGYFPGQEVRISAKTAWEVAKIVWDE